MEDKREIWEGSSSSEEVSLEETKKRFSLLKKPFKKKEDESEHKKKISRKSLIIGLCLGTVIGIAVAEAVLYFGHNTYAKEHWILSNIKSEAITDATDTELEEGAYDGIMAALGDKYAAYYTKEETDEIENTRSGSYEGIGVGIQDQEDGTVAVVSVYAGSSAENAGVAVGDIITKVGAQDAEGMTADDIVNTIAGMGSEVTMTFSRDGEEYEAVMAVTAIDIPSVAYELQENGTGYIAISTFRKNTADQFTAALEDLKSQGMTGLIIDLRENGGGLVDVTEDCLEQILPVGLEFYTKTKSGDKEIFMATGLHELEIPLVILVNENTASAAEIFAGACRDQLGAVLVGQTTYGKGIIQTTKKYTDGSSIKYTTAHYYTPSGYDLNGVGLEPDYSVDLPEDITVTACDENDTQYAKALEVLGEL